MSRCYFRSFAAGLFARRKRIIEIQAKSMKIFDDIACYDPAMLEKTFSEKHKGILIPTIRGFGYWIWKAQVAIEAFGKMREGDVLVYADSGVTLNVQSKEVLKDYIDQVRHHSSGILAFFTEGTEDYIEYKWSKKDLFAALGVDRYKSITDTPQYATGFLLLRKQPSTIRFIYDWLAWSERDGYHYLIDSPSKHCESPGFIEHRHDQSIFSILAKIYGAKALPIDPNGPFLPEHRKSIPLWERKKLMFQQSLKCFLGREPFVHKHYNKVRLTKPVVEEV